MSTIDDKVVELKFKNSQFQNGVDATLSAISKLKSALQFTGATKGLADIDGAAKKVKIDELGKQSEGVSAKFSAMAVVAVTALANIANRAVSTGLSLAKSLTMKPIIDGFGEYELKMGSIQTILANTERHGTSLATVNSELDNLNKYADRTIYNFAEMTKNASLFTNSGMKIEDATTVIKGFSNAAAASGTSATGAAGAAYQLSQAMSAGTVRLMDWRSLTNVGMGGKNMQESIIQIADAMGTFEGSGISATEAAKDFNGSLEKNWLSADVMSTYLRVMSGDMDEAAIKALGLSDAQAKALSQQAKTAFDAATKVRTFTQLIGTLQEATASGWTETIETIFGDFEQATEAFTAASEVLGGAIDAMSDRRNAMFSEWAELGGRTKLIEAIGNAFKALVNIMKPIKGAFEEVFPPMTGKRLFEITDMIARLTSKLIVSGETMGKIHSVFAGFFAVIDIGLYVLKMVVGVLLDVAKAAFSGGSGFMDMAASFGDWLLMLRESIKNGDGLVKFFDRISDVLVLVVTKIREFASSLMDGFQGFGASVKPAEKALQRVQERLTPLQAVGRVVGRIFGSLVDVFKGLAPVASKVGEIFGTMFEGLGQQIMDAIEGTDFNKVIDLINTGLFAVLTIAIKKFTGQLGGAVEGIGDSFSFLDNIKGAIEGVTETLGAMQATLKATTIMMIAVSLGLLTASLVALSLIDSERLGKALLALSALMGQLVVAMTALNGISMTGGVVKLTALGGGMVLLAVAIGILATAVKKLSDLDWEGLAKGLTGVVVLIAALTGSAKLLSGHAGGMITAGAGLILLATAIRILVSAVEDFSRMNWSELAKGLAGVAGLLVALGLFTKFSGVEKMGVLAGAGLVLLGAGIKILASAVEDFAGLSWAEIAKGLVSVGALLGAISLFAATSGNGVMLIGTAAALVIISQAMKTLAGVMTDFGSMSWEEIAKGLAAMGGALLIIAGAMAIMNAGLAGAAALVVIAYSLQVLAPVLETFGSMGWANIAQGLTMLAGSLVIIAGAMMLMSGALAGAAALIVVAGALAVMGPVLLAMSQLSWGEIAAGLAMLAGVFVVLGLAGVLLTPLVPTLLGLGIAIGLLGAGVALAGAGVFLFAAGLTALAAAGTIASASFVGMVGAILSVLPMIVRAVGDTIVEIAKAIAKAAPAVVKAITVVLSSLLSAIIKLTPQILRTFEVILRGLLQLINRNAGPIVQTFMRVLDLLLAAAVAAAPKIANAGLQIITKFLLAIRNNVPKIVPIAGDIIVRFINAIGNQLPRITNAGVELIVKFVNGVAQAIRNNTSAMNEAGRNLASAIVSGMVSGISGGAGMIADAARGAARGALNAAKNFLGINSPSKEFMKVGRWSSEGMAVGISKYSTMVEDAARETGLDAIFAMKKTISGLSEALDSELDSNPTITPVIDLSDVERGLRDLDPMLNGRTLSVDASMSRARAIQAQEARSQRIVVDIPNDSGEGPAPTIHFEQHLNSPKALSNAEIYRQTNNLISQAKGALKK